MDRRETVLFGLELSRRGSPLRGRLVSPGEPDRAFAGWLDFIAAVDAAHRAMVATTPVGDGAVKQNRLTYEEEKR